MPVISLPGYKPPDWSFVKDPKSYESPWKFALEALDNFSRLDPIGIDPTMGAITAAPVAVSLIRKSAPELLRMRLAMEVPERLPAASRAGLGHIQGAINKLIESHPRVMSHFRQVRAQVPDVSEMLTTAPGATFSDRGIGHVIRTKGLQQAKDRALAQGGAFDLTFNPNAASSITTPEEAMRLVGHEVGGHGVQTLMDPSRADKAYKALTETTGYRSKVTGRMTHPSEILSEYAGNKRAGVPSARTRDISPMQMLTGQDPIDAAKAAWQQAREAFKRYTSGTP